MKEACSRCNKLVDTRGMTMHLLHCKFNPSNVEIAVKDNVVVSAEDSELSIKIDGNAKIEVSDIKFIGPVECPKCHQREDWQKKIGVGSSWQEYWCGMCGFLYQRNLDNGKYTYD